MKLDLSFLNITLIVVFSYLLCNLLMYVVRIVANYVGAIDYPNEERRIHKKPTPRMGSLAIFVSFLIGYMIFGNPSIQMNSILIGSILLVLVGLIDDIKPIPNKYKFLVQFISSLIAVFYGGFLLKDINAFGIYIDFQFWAYPITIFFIMGCINCINLIDGMDGLAGGIVSIYYLTVGIISTLMFKMGGIDVLLCFLLLGCTLGYLKHNFYPAKIFMGDGGSMFFGYMIALIALIGYKNVTMISFVVPLILLAIPIFDTLFAIIRRMLKKENVMHADMKHIHFQLFNKNNSEVKTVLIIYGVDLLFAIISVLYVFKMTKYAIPIYIFLLICVVVLLYKTDIIFDRKKGKKKKRK